MPGRLAPPDPGPSHGSPGGLPDQLQLLEPAARGSLAHFKLPQLITSLSHRSTPEVRRRLARSPLMLPWRTARSTPTPQARCRGFLAHLKLLRLITSSLVASNPLLPRQHRLPSPSIPTDDRFFFSRRQRDRLPCRRPRPCSARQQGLIIRKNRLLKILASSAVSL
jgi:hypothetical protein